METSLAYNTVNPRLMSVLTDLMQERIFDDFVLVAEKKISGICMSCWIITP